MLTENVNSDPTRRVSIVNSVSLMLNELTVNQ